MRGKRIISVATIVLLIMTWFATPILAEPNNDQKIFSSDKKLSLIVQQMDSSLKTEKQKKDFSTNLASLTPDEVLTLKKMWRANLVLKGVISKEEVSAFPAIEKTEIIFSQKVKELYGDTATIYNIAPPEFSAVEEALGNDVVSKELTYSIENNLVSAKFTTASTCYYDNNWPQWLTAVTRSSPYYWGGGSGRVANSPGEWPCDFVIYIPGNTYTKVTGLNGAAQSVVDYSGGLSASPSRDAVIVGYWRVALYGWPTEDWVRNYILFKT